MSFSQEDLKMLAERGLSEAGVLQQATEIREGFPYLDILAPASLERGIFRLDDREKVRYIGLWDSYLESAASSVMKMVPASGAASRMFQELFPLMEEKTAKPETKKQLEFFDKIRDFAFYDRLNEVCLRNTWRTVPKLLGEEGYSEVVKALLGEKGLHYAEKPKGLLLFHKEDKRSITPVEEHLSEGAKYAQMRGGKVQLHFTVSPEHKAGFQRLIEQAVPYYEDQLGVRYKISFSEQKPSTDTVALAEDGSLFRDKEGNILFRPGGHGALIENLSELEADIVFIKNIDNVVPDYLKGDTIIYKKLLGGILVTLRDKIYSYLRLLEAGDTSNSLLEEIQAFLLDTLSIETPDFLGDDDKVVWMKNKLNRPIRVCGMVRNEGEPGGGPFLIREGDGSTSLQILESSQVNQQDEAQRRMLSEGKFFNPVDIVCSLVDYKGKHFDLKQYVNPRTAFVAEKSKDGRPLRALELPGLWNGAMHHWNTLFVEVPITTFNPVKTVNDLLRPSHQAY